MKRRQLLDLLNDYSTSDSNEARMVAETITFVNNHEDCFERSLLIGHITASGWIVNPERTHALLIHHYKLDKWFQPGGHADGDPDVLAVAIKETLEETGVAATPVAQSLFDVDIHVIPERKDIPEHLHYDMRFLLVAEKGAENLPTNRETKAVSWIKLAEVKKYNASESVMRMVEKTVKVS